MLFYDRDALMESAARQPVESARSGVARAFAPASIGNVAVGFDILGHSLAGAGDRAEVRVIDAPEVRIAAIDGGTAA